jgi:hypothetical protein
MAASHQHFLFKKFLRKEGRKTLYIKKAGMGAHPQKIQGKFKAPKHNPVKNITIKTLLIHKEK